MYRGILAAEKSKDYEIDRVEGGEGDVGVDWKYKLRRPFGRVGKVRV